MTTDSHDEIDGPMAEPDADEAAGIAEITLEDGGLVVYDRDNTDAWLQSRTTVTLDSMA
jgi:hypothetical protein